MITPSEFILSSLILLHIAFLIHAVIIAVNWVRNKSDRYGLLIVSMLLDNFLAVPVIALWLIIIIFIAVFFTAKYLFH